MNTTTWIALAAVFIALIPVMLTSTSGTKRKGTDDGTTIAPADGGGGAADCGSDGGACD